MNSNDNNLELDESPTVTAQCLLCGSDMGHDQEGISEIPCDQCLKQSDEARISLYYEYYNLKSELATLREKAALAERVGIDLIERVDKGECTIVSNEEMHDRFGKDRFYDVLNKLRPKYDRYKAQAAQLRPVVEALEEASVLVWEAMEKNVSPLAVHPDPAALHSTCTKALTDARAVLDPEVRDETDEH